MKNIFKYIKIIVNTLIVIVVLSFALVVCLQKFSNNELSFLNYRMFTVVSGSMVPKYEIGDVLLAKEINPEDIEVGDAVSYLGKTGQFKDKVITHEVIEIEKDNNGKYLFHTKGIASLAEDPVVSEEQLYGVIIGELTLLSFIYGIVAKPMGLFICVVIPIFYIIGSEFLSYLIERDTEKIEKAKKKKQENKKEENKNKKEEKKEKEEKQDKWKCKRGGYWWKKDIKRIWN